MEIRNISFSYMEYSGEEELPAEDRDLVSEARSAAMNAYAPYSAFRVGAAVRLESGLIIRGTNVENAAFPSGICAERNAISNAISNHPGDKPVAIAIAAMNDDGFTDDTVPPCGNCRQVIVEEEMRNGKPVRIILYGKSKILVLAKVSDLLPIQFNKNNLRSDFRK